MWKIVELLIGGGKNKSTAEKSFSQINQFHRHYKKNLFTWI